MSDLTCNPDAMTTATRFEIRLESGQIELLKWIASGLMLLDHINKYLLSSQFDWMFYLGRLSFPIFLIVLAYNLAHTPPDRQIRIMGRLTIFGVIATLPMITLGTGLVVGWWPLNVLFLMLLVTFFAWMADKPDPISLIGFLVCMAGACFVDYWHFGLFVGISAWLCFKRPNILFLALMIITVFGLFFVNGNFLAILALPVVFLVSQVSIQVPRLRWAFYVFYPAHLFCILIISKLF